METAKHATVLWRHWVVSHVDIQGRAGYEIHAKVVQTQSVSPADVAGWRLFHSHHITFDASCSALYVNVRHHQVFHLIGDGDVIPVTSCVRLWFIILR